MIKGAFLSKILIIFMLTSVLVSLVCVNVTAWNKTCWSWKIKAPPLSQWTTAAPSINQILPTIPLCIVTSSMCLFLSLFSHSCNVKQWSHIRTWTYRQPSPHQTAAWPPPSSGENQDICFIRSSKAWDPSKCNTNICITKTKIWFHLVRVSQFFHTMLLLQIKKLIQLQCNNHR